MRRDLGLALGALLLISAAVRIRYFTGLQVGDDVVYSTITVDRLSGTLHFGNVQQTRSGFLLPLLGSYALFGPGEVPLVLYNLLTSVALVAALFFLGRTLFGDPAGVLAAALAAVHPNLVRFATECHTDTPSALWLTLAVACLLSAGRSDRPRPRLLLGGLLLGWAYLHKEHAVFLLPFIAGHGLVTRRSWTWYLPMLLPLVAVVLAEFAAFALLTGNPLKRYEMIRYWHSGQYMRDLYPTAGAVLYRLFLDLPARLAAPWHGLVFPAAAVAAAFLRRLPQARWVIGWFLALYAGYSFWPSSLVPFRPGFALFEWTLPVLQPPLILLLAAGLARLRRAVAVLAALSAAHLIAIHSAWVREARYTEGAREAVEWIRRENPARVFADDKTIEALDFFEGHRPARRYLAFQSDEPAIRAMVVVDKFWTEPGRWWSRPVRPELAQPPPSWRRIHESPRLVIYRT
jgi:hypothetical protein